MNLNTLKTNRYPRLSVWSLCTLTLLILLTFQSSPKTTLIFTYETGVEIMTNQFKIFISVYFIILSGLAFVMDKKAELSVRLFWIYVALLIIPPFVLTLFTVAPEWTIVRIANYRGNYPGSYYDYINDYGLLNICLIAWNVIGLLIFGYRISK